MAHLARNQVHTRVVLVLRSWVPSRCSSPLASFSAKCTARMTARNRPPRHRNLSIKASGSRTPLPLPRLTAARHLTPLPLPIPACTPIKSESLSSKADLHSNMGGAKAARSSGSGPCPVLPPSFFHHINLRFNNAFLCSRQLKQVSRSHYKMGARVE
jgi:hypothetical protein